jgi:geranylgeranyl pyrophosphate synthase
MDDDDMRRGRPTTHRAFDTATATVAGVAMVPLAVEQAIQGSERLRLTPDATKEIVATLMHASGASGMVGGQLLDLMGEGRRLAVSDLETLHAAKTGALIAAAFTIGGIAAGASTAALEALSAAGIALGLAFQIADDVLDATASSAALGKTAGRDAALSKSTYASVLGVPSARSRSDGLVADAMTRLRGAEMCTPGLEHLAHFIAARRS